MMPNMTTATTTTTRLTERGQISIPATLRDSLGLRPGTALAWSLSDDGRALLAIPVAPVAPRARSAREVIGWGRKHHAPRRTADWMAELRAAEVSP